jgi:hypothetical protein
MGNGGSRIQVAATWLFVLPFFTAGVAKDAAKIEIAGMAVLAFANVVLLRRVPARAIERIYLTLAVLALIVIAYLAFRPWPAYAGSVRSYDVQAWLFVATYVTVAVFAVLFFEPGVFERTVWRASTVALWIGVLTCLASRLTGHALLVNPAYGTLRMQGTLSEPSAWSAVLTVVVLLALRRRSWFYMALALAGLVLADSPSCLLVLALAVPAYFALTSAGPNRGLARVGVGAVIACGLVFVQHASPQPYLASSNPAEVAVGRLLSGIRNVVTDGQQGSNSHFGSAVVTIADVRQNGWMLAGAGPAADETWFPAQYPATAFGLPVEPNALWVSVLFDFGEWGVAVLAVLMLTAVWRLRRSPVMCAILLPFIVMSLTDSAEGAFTYSFAALAVMLFAFGWAQPRMSPCTGLYASSALRSAVEPNRFISGPPASR